MTHAELVDRAVRWLRSQGCSTIVAQKSVMHWEEPDAIGWKSFGRSLLVECKASRADFIRDARKPFRLNPSLGIGTRRVYMAPAGIIPIVLLPPLWGLVEIVGRRAIVRVEPKDQPAKNHNAEVVALLAHIRRLEGKTKIPTFAAAQ